MTSVFEIKKLIETMAKTFDDFGNSAGLEGVGDVTKLDLIKFMMYLSASDGEIKWEEANFISDVSGFNLNSQVIANFIKENNIYSVEFEQTVPVSFDLAIKFDNRLYELDSINNDVDTPTLYISTYKTIGELFKKTDGDSSYNENNDFKIYINMLEDYANKNSARRKNSVFGFTKNSGNTTVPSKSGVVAPKKG